MCPPFLGLMSANVPSSKKDMNPNQIPFIFEGSTKTNTPNGSEIDEKEEQKLPQFDFEIGFQTPKKSYYEISPSNSEIQGNEFEIDVKPKRKLFTTTEEKKKFIQDYQRKLKTELCKNWALKGSCKFENKCSFAHGNVELKEKTHLHSNYKTKPCKQYFYSGFCPYGYRCQYLHSEIKHRIEFKNFLKQAYLDTGIPLKTADSFEWSYLEKIENLARQVRDSEDAILAIQSIAEGTKGNRRLPIFKMITSMKK